MGVTAVHYPPVEFLREQLTCLENDMYPSAVKVGMLGTKELAEEVGGWIANLSSTFGENKPLVVVDPVMISTSGHKLIDGEAKTALLEKVFPFADLVTPNKFEAEELLGRKLVTYKDVEDGAREILVIGPKAVLIKGGHSLAETKDGTSTMEVHDQVSNDFAQDYLLTNEDMSMVGKPVKDKPRLCDGSRGVWLRSVRCVLVAIFFFLTS
jgi:hydroxymethylpyrimidine kinase/phosphomethylpyrimidine kinase